MQFGNLYLNFNVPAKSHLRMPSFNLGIQTVLYLKYNLINGLVGVYNGKAEQPTLTRTANGANKWLVLHV